MLRNIRAPLALCGSVVLCMLIASPVASAHVLIFDTTRQTGAVLHATPDDDPIAGEQSNLYFDLAGRGISKRTHAFTLQVTNQSTDTRQLIPLSAGESSVSATYAFPHQGLYTITLTAEPSDSRQSTLRFIHTQRIARGEVSPASVQKKSPPSFLWAEIGLVFGVCMLLLISVIAWNKRRDIASYSSF